MKTRCGLILILLVMQQPPDVTKPETGETPKVEQVKTDPPASQVPKPAIPKPPAPKPPTVQPPKLIAIPPPATADDVAAAKRAADLAANAANAAAVNASDAKKTVAALTSRFDTESRLLRGLLIVTGLLGLACVALIAFSLFHKKASPEAIQTARRLSSAADKLDAALQLVDDKLQKSGNAIAARLAAANVVTPDQLNPIRADIDHVRDEIVRVSRQVEDIATRPPTPSQIADPVLLERQVLGEWWKLFVSNQELSAAIESAERESAWMPLIKELTRVVPADLKSAFDAVVAPCREHWSLLQKVKLVPRVAEGKAGDMASPAEEVRRTREYAGLLQSAQSGSEAASRLTFRFKNWVTDNFLPFADQYLQRYQQARLDNRHHELEPGVTLVRELLRIAAVEPIDVTPGETTFDSTRHVGRSTSNDQRFADCVITGVIRNGFIEGGQQVIRQPEVIVNRTRL